MLKENLVRLAVAPLVLLALLLGLLLGGPAPAAMKTPPAQRSLACGGIAYPPCE